MHHWVCGKEQVKVFSFFFFKGSVEALGMQKVLPGSASVLIPSHFDRETWRSLKALPPEQSSCLILCRKPTVNLCSPTRVKLQYRPEGVNVENVEDGRRFLLHADSLQLWQQHDESLRKGRLSKLTCKFFFNVVSSSTALPPSWKVLRKFDDLYWLHSWSELGKHAKQEIRAVTENRNAEFGLHTCKQLFVLDCVFCCANMVPSAIKMVFYLSIRLLIDPSIYLQMTLKVTRK